MPSTTEQWNQEWQQWQHLWCKLFLQNRSMALHGMPLPPLNVWWTEEIHFQVGPSLMCSDLQVEKICTCKQDCPTFSKIQLISCHWQDNFRCFKPERWWQWAFWYWDALVDVWVVMEGFLQVPLHSILKSYANITKIFPIVCITVWTKLVPAPIVYWLVIFFFFLILSKKSKWTLPFQIFSETAGASDSCVGFCRFITKKYSAGRQQSTTPITAYAGATA